MRGLWISFQLLRLTGLSRSVCALDLQPRALLKTLGTVFPYMDLPAGE